MRLLVLLFSCYLTGISGTELEIVNEWGVLEWVHGQPPGYEPRRAVPTSLEVGRDRLFLAIPRLFSGLPASLASLPRNQPGLHGQLNPKLQAYPSLEWHRQGGSCNNSIVNVFRMRLDKCNRLWVLDSGVRDTFQTFTVACQPKILVFDLTSDTLLRRIIVSEDLLRKNSLLTNIVLDDQASGPGRCDRDMTIYLSDASSPSIIVYSPKSDTMWRLSHPYMFPDPDYGTYTVEGESFTLMDGILGMALTPPGVYPKKLFFQPFASNRIFSIETGALNSGPNQGDDSLLPVKVEGRKSSQAAGMIFDPRDGSLYFSPVSEELIASWIPGTRHTRTVAHNRELLQFVLDLRSAEYDSHNIWFVSTKLQKYVKQTVDPMVPHVRIIRILDHQNHLNNTIFY